MENTPHPARIVVHHQVSFTTAYAARQHEEIEVARRIAEHRQGLHPCGSMRRDCPLCREGR